MAGVNKVIIIGNLGADPDLKTTNSGTSVCRLGIATTRVWTNKQTDEKQEETEWHRVTVWGKQADHCNNYLSKGRQVYVEGRLRTSFYEKEEYPGAKFYSTEIVADTVQFLGSRADADGGGGSGGGGGGGGGGNSGGGDDFGGDDSFGDDDIPF